MPKHLIYILLFFTISVAAQETDDLKLWYKAPSNAIWENALPIGNGFMGAMVYGDVEKEVFQLNEGTLWSGSPNRNDNPNAKNALSEIRQLIFQGDYKKAEKLTNDNIITKKSHGQIFQPAGNLQLDFVNHQDYRNYYRELDIEKAVTKTVYTVDGITYTREAFMSFPDRLLVISLSASKPGKLSFKASFNSEHKKQSITIANNNELSLTGTSGDHEGVEGKVNFNAIARFKVSGGSTKNLDNSIQIEKADSVLIFVSIATNFINYNDISGHEKELAKSYLDKAYNKNYDKMKKAHIAYYQNYFKRVQLDLGKTEVAKLPTDERLTNFRNATDPSFVTLYYQYGRYLLISASQPGGQAANLQGIWNGSMNPAWDSKYTININTEMNYWPAEKTNLSEMHEPLLRMIRELADTGKETAKVMYGARGWMAHHNTDIWRINGAVDGATWGVWNAGGGWLSQHLWEHYLYSGDEKYLESVYEVLKGAANFYCDFLVKDPANGWLVAAPGNSPENAPKAHQGATITAGSTMDNQIVFDVFSTAINASEVLGKDKEYADSLKVFRKNLPPIQIGKYNQIQEWLDDVDDPKDNHRHISHLYGLYPSNQISAYRTPELFAAANNTLLQRGDVSTGWSMGWKVNWWAKMQNGNHAYSLIQNQLTPLGVNKDGGGTYNNLFDAHPPFQIDGNFGCTSGITEMFMQSSDGAIHLLAALPDALKEYGEITGLKARGGFEITNMKWEKGKLIAISIKSNLGGNLRLRTGNEIRSKDPENFKTASGENTNPFYQCNDTAKPLISKEATIKALVLAQTYLYDVKTEKGKTYTFLSK